jgi:uncharacterized protein with von Willebrand factor type A (vWA) domain
LTDTAEKGPSAQSGGRLLENIMYFARVLRAAGLPVGPGRVLDALAAVEAVGLSRRDDLYWTLHALYVTHPRQREIFDQAFHIFWRNPKLLEQMMWMLTPELKIPPSEMDKNTVPQRLAEALFPNKNNKPAPRAEEPEEEFRATLTWSDRERLMDMDFDSMSSDEMRAAQQVIAQMKLAAKPLKVRRFKPSSSGHLIDKRASMRASLRQPDVMPLQYSSQRTRPPTLVTLCDISGSMSQYSRMILHFLHAVTSARDKVHSFVFGTRLTNITRHLRYRDVDLALAKVSEGVNDWNGGTRIAPCIEQFNRHWSRRVLSQGAVVILISDGLDRDGADGLPAQMKRLGHSCRRLIWLNPLLRYQAYEPRTIGARAILPWVDDFRSIHNLNSMADLAAAVSEPDVQSQTGIRDWHEQLRAIERAAQ